MNIAKHRHTSPYIIRLILSIIIGLVFISTNKSQEINYRAQSLFIYKFTKYIYWPEEKTQGDFLIGVFGNSPIYDELELMASLKKAGNEQDILIQNVTVTDSLSEYHIIYIASSKSRQLKTITQQIGDRPVLMVAEREGMANRGATINFLITIEGRLKFEVNMTKLEGQRLKISEEILKLGYKL